MHQHGCRCCECDAGPAFPPIPNAKTIGSLMEQRSDLMKKMDALQGRVAELEAWQAKAFEAHPNLDLDIEALNQ